MATAATKFRIDVSIHHLLQDSNEKKPLPVELKGLTLPTPGAHARSTAITSVESEPDLKPH